MCAATPNYVSIIGFNYLYPIVCLVEKLLDLPRTKANELQSPQAENGYAAATITLSVFLVESALARAQHDMKINPPLSWVDFLDKKLPNCTHTPSVKELFVIRDVIAHNHVWEASFDWDADFSMKVNWARLTRGYGDKKLHSVLDTNSRKSKILGLNLFPNRIARSDAFIVLRTTVSLLRYLEEKVTQYVNISRQHVVFRGQLMLFAAVIDELP